MNTIYQLKPMFQRLLKPIVRTLAASGVTANQVTISAMILSIVTGLLMTLYPLNRIILCLVPIVLFIRMALNAIDGILAKEFNMQSHLGMMLNELGDLISDVALFLPFALIYPSFSTLVVFIVILAVLSEMAGVLTIQVNQERRYNGPMGKSDRAFTFGAIALLLGLGVTPGYWLLFVWLAVIGLLTLTIINRVKGAL